MSVRPLWGACCRMRSRHSQDHSAPLDYVLALTIDFEAPWLVLLLNPEPRSRPCNKLRHHKQTLALSAAPDSRWERGLTADSLLPAFTQSGEFTNSLIILAPSGGKLTSCSTLQTNSRSMRLQSLRRPSNLILYYARIGRRHCTRFAP